MSESLSFKRTGVPARVIVAALFLGAVGFGAFSPGGKDDLAVTAVEKRDIESKVTAAGSIVPNRKTIFTPPYVGYLRKVHVKLGDMVKEGQPVVTVTQTLKEGMGDAYPLRAPFTGLVTQVLRGEGEWVDTTLQSAMVRMDDLSRLWVVCDVPENDVLKIKLGAAAKVKVNAVNDRSYEAVVRTVALAAKDRKDGWSRNGDRVEFEVRMEIVDRDESLRPGLSALVDIITESRKGVVSIPHEYLLKEGDKYLVTLPDGKKKEVKIGMKSDAFVEILEGLKENDRVRMVDFFSIKEGT